MSSSSRGMIVYSENASGDARGATSVSTGECCLYFLREETTSCSRSLPLRFWGGVSSFLNEVGEECLSVLGTVRLGSGTGDWSHTGW